jgi:hypothetical protein
VVASGPQPEWPDDDGSVEPEIEPRLVDRLGDDRQAILRERRRGAVARQIERDRTMSGGQGIQDRIPHALVERQPVQQHGRRA